MSDFVNHYQMLGVSPNASTEQIKEAFRKLARIHHPDIAGAASHDKFIAIHEAYQVLSDPERRRAFDAQLQGPSAPSGKVIFQTRPTPPPPKPSAPSTELLLKRSRLRDHLAKKRYTLVITEAEGYLQQTPDPEIRHILALAYQRLGNALVYRRDRAQAKHYLQKALATEPHNSELAFEVQRDLARLED